MPDTPHRCGFVSLLGRPNVGKSTLVNRILGQKVAIVSPKPQTTRNRLTGIHTTPDAQTIYVDTPGIHRPDKSLNQRMVREAREAAAGADLAVMLISAEKPWQDEDLLALELVESLSAPRLLAINKIDKIPRERLLPLIEHSSKLASFSEIIPVSALTGERVEHLAEVVRGYLPEGPALFPEDMFTDQAERFWVAEIVREKVVWRARDELPYSSAVVVEELSEDKDLIRIRAVVLVERESQKGIIIGKGGSMIKEIGTAARKELESRLGLKVFLELFVRVEKDWQRDPDRMREMGMS